MKVNAKKRVLSWVIAFAMIFAYVPQMAYATDSADAGVAVAAAGSIEVLDGQVSVTDSTGTGKISNGVITITAPGLSKPTDTLVPNTVTITNETAKYIEVSFDYKAENYYEFSEDQDQGNYSVVLAAGEAATLSISGKKVLSNNTAVLTLSNFNLVQVSDASKITFEYNDANGSVTAAGTEVAAADSVSATYTDGIELTATAASGAEFLGWINAETGKILSRETSFTYKPIVDVTVEAIFANDASGSYYLVGDRYILTDFAEAMATAENQVKKVVALMNDVTLTAGNYTVPAGVTLLVPFDKENTLYTTVPVGENGNYTTPVAYRTLTLAEGANLIVNGEMSLSAKHNAANSSARGSGAPFGDISFVEMEKNSNITVNDGAFLYAYGFIVGDGTVDIKSGGTVYENFQIEDFRGGSCTTHMAAKEEGQEQQGVLPISQYYVQNIEVPLSIEYGASEYCYTSLYMLGTVMGSSIKFIGDDQAMFVMKDGYVTKTYDGETDRLIVEGNGNMGVNPITVDLLGEPVNASMFDLPIGMNITISVNTGNVDIDQDIALLPGSNITIAEGASCTLGEGVSVYVYDYDQWGGYCGTANAEMFPVNYAPGKKYERTTADLVDASICVNGTLDASKGYIYTTTEEGVVQGGGNIYSTENGVVKIYSGEQEYTYQFIQEGIAGTYVPIYLLPANLVNENGDYVQTIDTTKAGTYTYENGKWQCSHDVATETVVSQPTCNTEGITTVTCNAEIPHTYDVVAEATGHKWEDDFTVDKIATCTEAGSESIHCSVCDATKDVTEIEALGHSFTNYEEITAATCDTAGSEKATCDRCDETDTQEIPALGHDYVYENETPATCTTEGSMSSGVCNVCGDEVGAGVIPALGHSFTTYTQTKAPTCDEDGVETADCDRCEASDEQAIPALGHSFTRYIDNNDATCTEKGTKTADCNNCDATHDKETEALGHRWEKSYTVDKEAGCETRGSKSKHCSVCDAIDESTVKVVYATGHDYGAWTEKTASTCTVKGTDERTCGVCGDVATRERALADHNWEDDFTVDVAATCGEAGVKSIHCADCDATTDETEIKATGHKFNYTDNGDATCTTAGTKTGTCEYGCGTEDTQTVEALGHDWESDYTVDVKATCTEAGSKSIHCSRCDAKDKVTAVAATGHSYTAYKDNGDATCTAAGTETAACDNGCGTKDTRATKATGHSFTEYEVVTAATCTADGSKTATCDNGCGAKDTQVITAAGHNWNKEYTVDKEPTCTAAGSESIHCAACDATRVARSIDPLGHDWAKEYTVDKQLTCTEAGSKSIHCSRCDAKDKVTAVAAAGHNYGAWKELKAATCTTEGSQERTCATCGSKETGVIPVKAHTAVIDAAVAATCTATGLTEGSHCSVCNTVIKAQETVAVTAHTWAKKYTVDKTATTGRAGSKSKHCSVCDTINKDSVVKIARIKKTTANALIYNGKKREANLTVVNFNGKKLKKGTDYTVAYKNAKGTKAATPRLVGKYTVVVTFKGDYSGTVKKQFNINPQGTKITKLTKNGKKQFTAKWNKKTVQVTGYQIRYSTKQNMKGAKTVTVTKAKTTKRTIKGLKAKKKYWVQIRTYKTVNGQKYFSGWSVKKTIKTK